MTVSQVTFEALSDSDKQYLLGCLQEISNFPDISQDDFKMAENVLKENPLEFHNLYMIACENQKQEH